MCIYMYVIMYIMRLIEHLISHPIITSLVMAAKTCPSRMPSEHLTGRKSLDLFDLHASVLGLNKIYLGTPMVCF